MSKLIYLIALVLVCLNLVSCGNPTTLSVTKKSCYDQSKKRYNYRIAAKLEIPSEGIFTIGEQKACQEGQESIYYSYLTKDKKFGVHVAMAKYDLTYTSKGRSQYIEKPAKVEDCNGNGCRCNTTTYYGWM